jgi:hypothetical protein
MARCPVAIVSAVDSAGFFVAPYGGTFRAQGLSVHFIPAVTIEAGINLRAGELPVSNPVDISRSASLPRRPVKGGCHAYHLDLITPGRLRRAARLPERGNCDLSAETCSSDILTRYAYYAC